MNAIIAKPMKHESIADIEEGPFIKRVLNDVHHRGTLFNVEGLEIEGARIRDGVSLQGYRKDIQRDVDILVLPADHPERATAIQVKRVKVGANAVRTGKPNRLDEFEKGVDQANRDAELGFSQVYLWVFVLIDTREQNAGEFTYAGVSVELKASIERAISLQRLHPRVGLMQFEWVQPMDRPPLELGTYHGHLRRKAERVEQHQDLTHWLSALT